MADETVTTTEYTAKVVDAMIEMLRAATTPEMMRTQQVIAQRMALAGGVVPSRIPAPRNITEVGGYLNLLATLKEQETRSQVLASVLGVAGPPANAEEWFPPAPALFFAVQPNDRPGDPAGGVQRAIPLEFSMRSDFVAPLASALKTIHDRGCQLPLLSQTPALPPADSAAPAADELLGWVGRRLELFPLSACADPDADPLAVAQPAAGGTRQVVARQLDATAPRAADVTSASWNAWQCTAAACQQVLGDRKYLPLAPILNAAGWYQPEPGVPQSSAQTGAWHTWTNITGLLPGVTTFGAELSKVHTATAIAQSSLRDRLSWIWNGSAFAS